MSAQLGSALMLRFSEEMLSAAARVDRASVSDSFWQEQSSGGNVSTQNKSPTPAERRREWAKDNERVANDSGEVQELPPPSNLLLIKQLGKR